MRISHSFDVSVATELGIEEAVVYNNVVYWILFNKANNVNLIEGKTWCYQSAKSMSLIMPYMSCKTIQRALGKLVKAKYLISRKFESKNFKQVHWYSLYDESILDGASGQSQKRSIDETKLSNRSDSMSGALNTSEHVFAHGTKLSNREDNLTPSSTIDVGHVTPLKSTFQRLDKIVPSSGQDCPIHRSELSNPSPRKNQLRIPYTQKNIELENKEKKHTLAHPSEGGTGRAREGARERVRDIMYDRKESPGEEEAQEGKTPIREYTWDEYKAIFQDKLAEELEPKPSMAVKPSETGLESHKSEGELYPHQWGCVKLTQLDYEGLVKKNGSVGRVVCLAEEMADWCAATGKTYQDYGAAMRQWLRKRMKDEALENGKNNFGGMAYDAEYFADTPESKRIREEWKAEERERERTGYYKTHPRIGEVGLQWDGKGVYDEIQM